MILDLSRFIEQERPYWAELDALLRELEQQPSGAITLPQARRLHYLHARAASDLARAATFSGEAALQRELETLVARAHAEVHATSGPRLSAPSPWRWLTTTFPSTFRRHIRLFATAVAIFLVGALFGAGALAFDPHAKQVIMPFSHLMQDPSDRVAEEERQQGRGGGHEASFSAQLMTHNTRVSIATLALGSTYGVGTTVMLFYNGVILGAVGFDYMRAGESLFLFGWLLPHGSIEIPAILIAGQAGLLLASVIIGGGKRQRLRERLRGAAPDLVTLACGVALLLVWAGVVEATLSQLHAPILPYSAKIAFGTASLVLLGLYLGVCGRGSKKEAAG